MVRDRWVALGADAPSASATSNGSAAWLHMTTKPVTLPRCRTNLSLTLNAEVSVGGALTVALLDAGGSGALHGYAHNDSVSVVGNRLAAPVMFRNEFGEISSALSPPEEAVVLDFRLRPPVLVFAWEFHCASSVS